jgi:hypothetical protein
MLLLVNWLISHHICPIKYGEYFLSFYRIQVAIQKNVFVVLISLDLNHPGIETLRIKVGDWDTIIVILYV